VELFLFFVYNKLTLFGKNVGWRKRMTQKEEITLGDIEGKEQHYLYYNTVMYEYVVGENYKNMVEYCVRRFAYINLSDTEDLVQQVFTELLKAVEKGIRKKTRAVGNLARWL